MHFEVSQENLLIGRSQQQSEQLQDKLGKTAIIQQIINILESIEFFSLAENVGIIKSRDQLVLLCATTRNVKVKGRWNN